MSEGIFKSIRITFYNYRFYLLLAALILNFFIPPLNYFPLVNILFKLMTIAILLMSGANFIQKKKNQLRNFWFIFGVVNIVVAIFSELNPGNIFLASCRYILLFAFFLVITVNLLQQIFSIKEVTVEVIIGSFCGYLLLGIISFFLFALIDYSDHNAFSGLSDTFSDRVSQLFYFTFICLNTIGFGDILPLSTLSQKLAVFTACVGQFYIAVIVAILVSRFLNTSKNNNEVV